MNNVQVEDILLFVSENTSIRFVNYDQKNGFMHQEYSSELAW